MSAQHSKKVNHLIEDLCQLGCSEVNNLLNQIKHGSDIAEFADLSSKEIEQITAELESIMSVYSCDNDDNGDTKQ